MIYIVNKATEADVLQHFGDIKSDGVGYERETPKVVWNRYIPVHEAGTIVLSKNDELYYCWYEDYVASEWTGYIKEGVIVAPSNHFPDNKYRMIPLSGVTNTAGTAGSYTTMKWGSTANTVLQSQYLYLPTWDNNGTYSDDAQYIVSSPSNNNNGNFTGDTYYNDNTIKYSPINLAYYGLSPYLSNGSLDPHFRSGFTDSSKLNAYNDINGPENTSVLYTLGSTYAAASACYNFKNGNNGGLFTVAGTWYLPACGELIYIVPRYEQINSALSAVGGVNLPDASIWSSTEANRMTARMVNARTGRNENANKGNVLPVIPFAKV